jgi:hypothetical protein
MIKDDTHILLLLEKKLKIDKNSFCFDRKESELLNYPSSYVIKNTSTTLTYEKYYELQNEIIDILEDPEKFMGGIYDYYFHIKEAPKLCFEASCMKIVEGGKGYDGISSTDYWLKIIGQTVVQQEIEIELD